MIRPVFVPRIVPALAAALVLAALLVLQPGRALADPAISVAPTTSYAYDTFIFSGSGFPVGVALKASFTDPSGGAGSIADSYGNDASIKVGNDGSWELRVQPGSAFRSTATGTYHVSFCQADAASTCWSTDVKVSNDVPGMGGGGGGSGY